MRTAILVFVLLYSVGPSDGSEEQIKCDNQESCCLFGKEFLHESLIWSVPIKGGKGCTNVVCEKGKVTRSKSTACIDEHQSVDIFYSLKDKQGKRDAIKRDVTMTTTTALPFTETTTPLNCNYLDPFSQRYFTWESDSSHVMDDGRVCFCYYGSVDCQLDDSPVLPKTTTTLSFRTTTTPFYFTPLYCFYKDTVTENTFVWRGGTNHGMTDGRMCRCEWWGRVNCHKPQH